MKQCNIDLSEVQADSRKPGVARARRTTSMPVGFVTPLRALLGDACGRRSKSSLTASLIAHRRSPLGGRDFG